MDFPQLKSVDGRVELTVGPRRAALAIDGTRVAGFDVIHERALTLGTARKLSELDPSRSLVAFGEASPPARAALREAGVSYASEAGEMYIHAPPVHVEVPARSRSRAGDNVFPSSSPSYSPFPLRGSRIPRWLLLNLDRSPTFTELSELVELSESNVSRTVRALADDGLLRIERDPRDSRSRQVEVDRPGLLLESFEESWRRRRVRSITVDVGARDVAEAERALARVAERRPGQYTIGGLAGAERFAKVVQPASLTAWVAQHQLESWAEELGGYVTRPRPGSVTLKAAPDSFVLSLAFESDRLRVADPVQLYLDCRHAGERALEAAAAIRAEMGW